MMKGLAAVSVAATLFQPQAAGAWSCVGADEVHAFTLRHLQSSLMVAALSCNQRDAYNDFMTRFQGPLADGGRLLIAYFNRAGGGKIGLNRYVTDLANTAGLDRAADPQGFCEKTWEIFWNLQQSPETLRAVADMYMAATADRPAVCTAAEEQRNARKTVKTAATREAVAAAETLPAVGGR
jgi:hypothetical protein